MIMSFTHLHLMLNHVPVLGIGFGLGLLLLGLWRKNEELKKAALGLFVIVTLVSVPVYLTGEPAEDKVKSLPGIADPIIEQHEDAAAVAFSGIILVGVAALAGLLWFRCGRLAPAWFAWLMVATSLAATGLMAWTANVGGQIRHTEIRADSNLPAATGGKSSD